MKQTKEEERKKIKEALTKLLEGVDSDKKTTVIRVLTKTLLLLRAIEKNNPEMFEEVKKRLMRH